MRRVLCVIPAPTFGGAANQVMRLHGPLREAGWEMVAVLPSEPGNATERLRDAGVEVHLQAMHRLRATRSPGPHLALARHTGFEIGALRRLVLRTGASAVQNHGDLNPQAGIAGHLEGAAVHWHLLDTRTPMALRRATMQLVTRLADSISTVGHALARDHPGALDLGERCVVVYPPVDPAAFASARDRRAAAREELDVPDRAICVGAIGNRNPQKGHEWLIRAVARVRAERDDVVLRILGAPSPGHEEYEAGLRAEGERLGPGAFGVLDPGRRVPELIGGLDVLALASVPNSEGMPTVILEAMAAGVPVVATDVGAVSEQVEDGRTGRVVAPEDDAALAGALLELARSPDLRERMAAAGRRRLDDLYGLDRLVGLYAQGYELALEHRLRRRRRAAALR